MYSRKKSVGVGGRILTYLEKQAKKLGYSRFVLETRKCNEKAVISHDTNNKPAADDKETLAGVNYIIRFLMGN